MQSTREYFALRVKETGQYARLCHEMTDFRDAFYLTPDDSHPVFEAPSLAAISFVLFGNTSESMSSARCPGWGDFDKDDLEVVKVVETTEVTPVTLRTPLQVVSREKRRMHGKLTKLYTGDRVLPGAPDSIVFFWLVTLPEGETFETAKDWEGLVVYPKDDKYGGHKLLLSLPVPEDYSDILAGPNDALFLVEEACSYL